MNESCVRDQHGNQWRIIRESESKSNVQVLAADGDGEWRPLADDQSPPTAEST